MKILECTMMMFGIPVGYSTPFTITDMSTKVYIDEIHLFILNNRQLLQLSYSTHFTMTAMPTKLPILIKVTYLNYLTPCKISGM